MAIVGGGVAGCSAAAALRALGVGRVAVFDTGRHGVGGRLASRLAEEGSLPAAQSGKGRGVAAGDVALRFDHACQFFSGAEVCVPYRLRV